MAKKRRKSTVRSAGRATAAELRKRAQAVYDDPTPIIPQCDGPCIAFSPVTQARRQMLKIHERRDDVAFLRRASNRGNDLARAYAGTLLLVHTDEVPYVADITWQGEKRPYVMRGKAKPRYLAAVQHHHDPAARLMAVSSWVQKRGLHIFSTQEGLVCTGSKHAPPASFVTAEAHRLHLQSTDDGRFVCEHGGLAADEDAIAVTWRAADAVFERCMACSTGSLLGELIKRVAGPRLYDQFDVAVRLKPLEVVAGRPPEVDDALPQRHADDYLRVRILDDGVVAAARATRAERLRDGPIALVDGDRSFGDDIEAFIGHLGARDAEADAVRAGIAAAKRSVVVERASTARVIADLWPDVGRDMLMAVSDETTADALLQDEVRLDEATHVVNEAAKRQRESEALKGLPEYADLPPAAAVAHRIARTYRRAGKRAGIQAAVDSTGRGEVASVVLAFLEHFGAAKGEEWRFTRSDRDVAASLTDHVDALLSGPLESYHAALSALAQASGETRPFSPK